MEYPNEFPQDARARVDAAQVKAERDFVKAEQTLESSPSQYQSAVENLAKHYINSVFFSFANEAIRVAKEGIWPACRIQPELEKFGASLIFTVECSKFYYRNGWAFPQVNALYFRAEVWTGIKSSERWLAFLDDLTAVAEAQADAASSNLQVGASNAFRTETSVNSSVDESEGVQRRSTAKWGDIEIRFTSEERIQIIVAGKNDRPTYNYEEFGLFDRRKGTPNLAWITLRCLAEARGTLKQSSSVERWSNTEKHMQELRAHLRKHFGLQDDPLPFVNGIGYQAKFKINCSQSFQT